MGHGTGLCPPILIGNNGSCFARGILHLKLCSHRWSQLNACSVLVPTASHPETNGVLACFQIPGNIISDTEGALVILAHMRSKLIGTDPIAVDKQLEVSKCIDIDIRPGRDGLEFCRLT